MKVRDKIGIVGGWNIEIISRISSCLFFYPNYFSHFFDRTKRDVLDFLAEGLQFIFLPFVFLFVLVYDFINKR